MGVLRSRSLAACLFFQATRHQVNRIFRRSSTSRLRWRQAGVPGVKRNGFAMRRVTHILCFTREKILARFQRFHLRRAFSARVLCERHLKRRIKRRKGRALYRRFFAAVKSCVKCVSRRRNRR